VRVVLRASSAAATRQAARANAGRIKPAPFLSSRTAWENYLNFFLNQNRRHGLISSLIVIGMPATLAIKVANLPDHIAA
jgi:hypothetical protein